MLCDTKRINWKGKGTRMQPPREGELGFERGIGRHLVEIKEEGFPGRYHTAKTGE